MMPQEDPLQYAMWVDDEQIDLIDILSVRQGYWNKDVRIATHD